MTFGEGFSYATLRDELVVGEVYVRVYNLQPTFVLEVSQYAVGSSTIIPHYSIPLPSLLLPPPLPSLPFPLSPL